MKTKINKYKYLNKNKVKNVCVMVVNIDMYSYSIF